MLNTNFVAEEYLAYTIFILNSFYFSDFCSINHDLYIQLEKRDCYFCLIFRQCQIIEDTQKHETEQRFVNSEVLKFSIIGTNYFN